MKHEAVRVTAPPVGAMGAACDAPLVPPLAAGAHVPPVLTDAARSGSMRTPPATAMAAAEDTALIAIPSAAFNDIVGKREEVRKSDKKKCIRSSPFSHILKTDFQVGRLLDV